MKFVPVKWEYGTLRTPKIKDNLDIELCKLGAEGWEAWHFSEEQTPDALFQVVRLKRIIPKAGEKYK